MKKILIFSFLIATFIVNGEGLQSDYKLAINSLNNKTLDSAKIDASHLLLQAKAEENKFYLVKAYYLLGYISAQTEDFGNAVIYYLEGARFAESQDNEEIQNNLISIYENLANILGDYGHYQLAHKFINNGLHVARKINNTDQEIRLLSNRVHEYVEDEKFTEAISEIDQILNNFTLEQELVISLKNKAGVAYHGLNDLSNAKANYHYIIKNAEKNNRYFMFSLHNIGEILLLEEKFSAAIPYFEDAIKLGLEASMKDEVISSYCNLAKIYSYKGEYLRALNYLMRAKEVDLKIKSQNSPNTHYLYNQISEVYQHLNHSNKALEYKNLYSQKLEEFIAKQKEIEELDKKYNIQLLTERYFDLLAANEEKRQAERLAQFGVGGTTAFFLIVLAFIYFRQHHVRSSIQREIKEIESISKV